MTAMGALSPLRLPDLGDAGVAAVAVLHCLCNVGEQLVDDALVADQAEYTAARRGRRVAKVTRRSAYGFRRLALVTVVVIRLCSNSGRTGSRA